VIDGSSLERDPRFNNADGYEFTLEAGFSPCIDAGHPLSGYDDADGSRKDMDIFGGPFGDWDLTW
jgi:hypothetical protein